MDQPEGHHVRVSGPAVWQLDTADGRSNLLKSLEPLKWPMKVDYGATPADQRRAFERAYQDLLYLQSE